MMVEQAAVSQARVVSFESSKAVADASSPCSLERRNDPSFSPLQARHGIEIETRLQTTKIAMRVHNSMGCPFFYDKAVNKTMNLKFMIAV